MTNYSTARRINLIRLPLLLLGTLIVSSLQAEDSKTYNLSGRVLEAGSQHSIPGANIIVMNQNIGTAADNEGRFMIMDLLPTEYNLQVSAIGYESAYIPVTIPFDNQLVITLKETFFQMESVVVTGTRTEKIHLNTPVATELITTQDIKDSGARHLGELLEQRSGVSVSSSVEGGTIVNVLGMDSKYVMLLVDGQPITGKFNNRVLLDQIPTASIKKVEIVKGPGSSLYGSEAMGGVINVITKKETQGIPLTVNVRHSDQLANYKPADMNSGQRNITLTYQNSGNGLNFNLNADLLLANVDKSIQHIDVDKFQTTNLGGDLRFAPGANHSVQLGGSYFKNTEQGSASLLNSETYTARSSANAIYKWTRNDHFDLQLRSRGSAYERGYQQIRPWGDTLRDELTKENQVEFETISNFYFNNSTLTLGSELGSHTYLSERVAGGKKTVTDQALFFQMETNPGKDWTLVAGARGDQSSDFSRVINPRLALMYQPSSRWRYRVSTGTGYRKPSFMDRYIDWNHQQFGYRIEGNPDLSPERSKGVSLGVDYYHPSEYQASLFVYRNRFSDMIVDSLLQPGLFTYVNVAQVDYSGIELQVRWKVNKSWLTSWGYTFSLNENVKTGEVVPNLPVHSGTFRLTYKQTGGRYSVSSKIKAVDGYIVDEFIVLTQQLERSRRDGYIMLDLDSHYNLFPWLRLTAGLKNALNITDDRYGPFFGRTLYLEIQTQWKGN
ncbi:MAG: TonB-dependent receptor [Candidatus Marinimicrobia bacterium]|nr:TonB-dependent receptor [Candidatus Neomarinimicrobiota bacterium]MCF7904182.1 TonB-dependent receptor [Candidatus Neomarinimicrobiota bacterium]